jgi:hypothetical protein
MALTLPATLPAAEDEHRQYDIELVIFENLVAGDNGEVWPADYSGWFEESLDEAASPKIADRPRHWLDNASLRLGAERNAMGKSSRYRPLAHFGWREVVQNRQKAQAFEIPVEKTTRSYVDGTVRVAVERYLHLYLDLQLHPASQVAAPLSSEPDYEVPAIRLTESRRMRSKEVHYFDNPRFGVIALITPYEPTMSTEKPVTEAPAPTGTQP